MGSGSTAFLLVDGMVDPGSSATIISFDLFKRIGGKPKFQAVHWKCHTLHCVTTARIQSLLGNK